MPSKIKISSKTNIGTSHYSTPNFLRSYIDRKVPLALKKKKKTNAHPSIPGIVKIDAMAEL